MKPPVQKNDNVKVAFTGLTAEGQGVGKYRGFAVFCENVLPGEEAEVHIIKVASGYAVGKLLRLNSLSPDRIRPDCPAFPACGGCTLRHLSYDAQLTLKQSLVRDALVRLGGIENPPVSPCRGMTDPLRYRNKGSFPFGLSGETAVFGFYGERSHRLVPLTDCLIQHPAVFDVARRVRDWANRYGISVYDESTGRGLLRHCMARVTTTGERMAVIVISGGNLPYRAELLSVLSDLDSVYLNVNRKNTNVIFGEEFRLLSGSSVISETILGLTYRIAPQSFLQVNPVQTAVLYDRAISLLDPKAEETVVDAYCGAGTISLLLAKRCKRVIGIEAVPEAIRDAHENAAANGIANAEFLCGKVEDVLPSLSLSPDAVILDPPRKGCEEAVLASIADSGIRRMVYVSCNPATLARDCKYLVQHGFSLVTAEPVDMFPYTGHVETVVLMSKVK